MKESEKVGILKKANDAYLLARKENKELNIYSFWELLGYYIHSYAVDISKYVMSDVREDRVSAVAGFSTVIALNILQID